MTTSLTLAIAQKLRGLMGEHETKQADLAAAIGVHQVTVSRWARGTRSLSVEDLVAVCHFFGVEPADFLSDAAQRAASLTVVTDPGQPSDDEALRQAAEHRQQSEGQHRGRS